MARLATFRELAVLIAAALALAVAGCGGDDDGDGGTGPTGAGEEITQANAAVVQAQVSNSIAQAIAKGPGTHNGAVSGTVKITQSIGKLAQYNIRYSVKFNNYSDDGEIWLDGDVDYVMSGTTFHYTIDLEISGAYSGEIEGEISYGAGGAYSGYWNVNGQRIEF